jgi:hypothetical protein
LPKKICVICGSGQKIRFYFCNPWLEKRNPQIHDSILHLHCDISSECAANRFWPIRQAITIHQEIEFNASQHQLYEALLDSKQFTDFCGRPAEINCEVSGAFSLFKVTSLGATSNSFRISESFKRGA